MSFKNHDLKGLQIEFNEVLAPRFSISEIRLIWRESLRHFFGITPSDLMLSKDRIFSRVIPINFNPAGVTSCRSCTHHMKIIRTRGWRGKTVAVSVIGGQQHANRMSASILEIFCFANIHNLFFFIEHFINTGGRGGLVNYFFNILKIIHYFERERSTSMPALSAS